MRVRGKCLKMRERECELTKDQNSFQRTEKERKSREMSGL